MPINSVIHTNRHSVDRVLNAGLPVVLVFWDRNGGTGVTDGELEELAAKYGGRAFIAKVDAKEETELVSRFQMNGVPSLAFFKDGHVIERTQLGDPRYVEAWLNHLTGDGKRPATPGAEQRYSGNAEGPGARANGPSNSGVSGPVVMTDGNFDSLITGSEPVLVDFWAEWCGPCRMVAPSVEQLAHEFSGRAVIGKLNVDQNPAVARRYNIMSIPTLMIFKNGQIVDQIVGAQSLPVLRQRLAVHAR